MMVSSGFWLQSRPVASWSPAGDRIAGEDLSHCLASGAYCEWVEGRSDAGATNGHAAPARGPRTSKQGYCHGRIRVSSIRRWSTTITGPGGMMSFEMYEREARKYADRGEIDRAAIYARLAEADAHRQRALSAEHERHDARVQQRGAQYLEVLLRARPLQRTDLHPDILEDAFESFFIAADTAVFWASPPIRTAIAAGAAAAHQLRDLLRRNTPDSPLCEHSRQEIATALAFARTAMHDDLGLGASSPTELSATDNRDTCG